MSKTLNEWMGESLLGKTAHFKGGCFLNIDATGKIVDYTVVNNEVVFQVKVGPRVISIGSNTPNLYIEPTED